VLDAVKAVNTEICDAIRGADVREQRRLDNIMRELDGTENKSRLGANAILGVSLAVARLAAQVTRQPLYRYLGGLNAGLLPVPCMNIINGGVHARGQGADFQEFMIAPHGASTLTEAVRQGSEVYQALRQILVSRISLLRWVMKADLPLPSHQTESLWNSSFRPLKKPVTVRGRHQYLYGPGFQRILS
jgi:enolase